MSSGSWSDSIFATRASSCPESAAGPATAYRSESLQLRVEEVCDFAETFERRVHLVAPPILVAIVGEIDRQRAAHIDDADVRKRRQRRDLIQHRVETIDQIARDADPLRQIVVALLAE